MAIFNSYVSLPEGMFTHQPMAMSFFGPTKASSWLASDSVAGLRKASENGADFTGEMLLAMQIPTWGKPG